MRSRSKLHARLLTIVFFVIASNCSGQSLTKLTLQQAYDLAQKNYPAIKRKDLVKRTEYLTLENLKKGFLPQVNITGQATYQSEVTGIDLSLPGINIHSPAKDQYKVVADVSQVIYDGGVIRQQERSTLSTTVVDEQQVEVELYGVKERINQIYLGILFVDEEIKQAQLVKNDIEVGVKQVQAQVNNGVAFRSGVSVLKAQALQTDQRVIELGSSKQALLSTLALFLNHQVDDSVYLATPAPLSSEDSSVARPELKLYEDQQRMLQEQKKLINAKNLPRASVFAQGGYGRPGLNLLKDEFDWFYIAGVRLNWSLGGLYTARKDKELNEVSQKMVSVQQETFLLNTDTELKQIHADIDKFRQLISTDQSIIDLRVEVKKAAVAQLENGVITANDYLREVNAEDQSRQSLISHQIQLLQSQINYQTTLGKQ